MPAGPRLAALAAVRSATPDRPLRCYAGLLAGSRVAPMRVLGIDFGTSNTVGMLRTHDGRVRPLLFDGSPLLPSAVYLNPDRRMLVGRDAERNARLDPSRFEPNPKRRIDDGQIFLGEVALPVPRVFGYVLGQVAVEARRQLGAAASGGLWASPNRCDASAATSTPSSSTATTASRGFRAASRTILSAASSRILQFTVRARWPITPARA